MTNDSQPESGGVVSSTALLGDPPQLPEKVSNDGREIWDWAGKMSEHIHRQAKMSELRTQLSRVGTGCGDCYKWMHSNSCPRETNVNGRRRGPSMNAPICNQYVEKQSSSEWREELQKRLDALKSPNDKLTNRPSK